MTDALWTAAIFLSGLVAGMLSGLFPGLHPNLISAVAVLQDMEYWQKAVFLTALYAGHIMFSAIPAIFFGMPDERTAVSVLPGQRMVLEGKGITALKTAAVSTLLAAALAAILVQPAMAVYPVLFEAVRGYTLPLLLLASAAMVLKSRKRAGALLVFLGSGLLGAYALDAGAGLLDPFLPLFSGFFAMGAILNYRKTRPAPQKEGKVNPGILQFVALGAMLGGLANLLPGIGSPGQVAGLASIAIAFESESYLAAVAAIGVGQFVFALASSASMDKARHGVIVNLGQVVDIGNNMQPLLLIFLLGIAISGLLLYLVRKRAGSLAGLDFSEFNKLLAAYLVLVVLALDGLPGLAVFALSSAIGYLAVRAGVERTMMMGAVIVPTIFLLAH